MMGPVTSSQPVARELHSLQYRDLVLEPEFLYWKQVQISINTDITKSKREMKISTAASNAGFPPSHHNKILCPLDYHTINHLGGTK